MAKWKFHVVLPDGSEYLTETLEEARSLEARYGRSMHLPMRQRVAEAPAAVSTPVVVQEAEENPRQSPQRVARVEGRDPRNPPVGTVLSKNGLTVVFDFVDGVDVYHVVAPTRQAMRGSYTSLSGLVRKFLNAEAYNGFQFFGLQGGYTGKYAEGTVGEAGMQIARHQQDTPVSEYAAYSQSQVTLPPPPPPPPEPALEPPDTEKTPLYGHNSEETAYVVDDYPYGFRARTQIRYWTEYTPNRGFRYASQTLNPRVHRWNAPNKSTYAELAGQLYLNRDQHVQFARLTEYSNANQVREFLRDFPQTDKTVVRPFVLLKIQWLRRRIASQDQGQVAAGGSITMERLQQDLAQWQEAARYL